MPGTEAIHNVWEVAGIIAAQAGAAAVVWLQVRSKTKEAKDEATRAATTAEEARELARPTGNGYAATTLSLLQDIRDQVALTQESVAEVRGDVRDLRSEVKEDRQTVARHITDFGRHVADHARGVFDNLPKQRNNNDPQE